jgi:dihydrofolate synthase/folylpolyglutamate synthase
MSEYDKALSYLESFVDYERTPPGKYDEKTYSLSRMEKLLDYLGSPHKSVRCIHIAGTNGKGSTGAMLTSILKESGLRVGFYSSPHLVSFRERIRIGADLISKKEICRLTGVVKLAVERLAENSFPKPSFFEVYTALAFLYFTMAKVDFAVIETGLGGRLDATNVIIPELSIITSIDVDHTTLLGKTRAAVAGEKSGIIKDGVPVLTSSQAEDVLEIIEEKCEEKGNSLTEIRAANPDGLCRNSLCSHEMVFLDYNSVSLEGSRFSVYGKEYSYDDLSIPLLGEHQVLNAGIAVAAARFLGVGASFIRAGLRHASWPGRLQLLKGFRGITPILLDGAHNPAAARALANAIKILFGDRDIILVIGISSDKDIRGIGKELLPFASRVILTRANNPRALDPVSLRKELGNLGKGAKLINSSADALKLALKESSEENLICVSGSLFLVGEVLQHIGES